MPPICAGRSDYACWADGAGGAWVALRALGACRAGGAGISGEARRGAPRCSGWAGGACNARSAGGVSGIALRPGWAGRAGRGNSGRPREPDRAGGAGWAALAGWALRSLISFGAGRAPTGPAATGCSGRAVNVEVGFGVYGGDDLNLLATGLDGEKSSVPSSVGSSSKPIL